MRLIDADALKERAFGKRGGLIHTSDIDAMPTVDAVPVVPCKECKMWNTEWKHEAGDCYCYKFFQWTDPDFFCAGGERRGKDETD